MNRVKFLLLVLCLAGTSFAIAGGQADIAERIKKVGAVCVEETDCSAALVAPIEVASVGGSSVEPSTRSREVSSRDVDRNI